MYVIGTAGHVDHGKSTLVQALTGIDPDRLREEKERGMTIDLGFAWLKLPGGDEVSIVDVPGHERFIKNMLAGVGGIDLALLVVAADEGVMPQTTEHLAILDLLDIRSGVVAVTKADLVEPEWLELVCADVTEALAGTTLAGSPLVPCSAVTREGLPALLETIEATLSRTEAKRDIGRPRLAIDRAFTLAGFGTVVTGTLIDGELRLGDDVVIEPGETRSRIRGLQSHRQKVERSRPGTRTAVNLANVSTDEIHRGKVLTSPSWLVPTTAVDVHLQVIRGLARPLKHDSEVTFHTGAAEVPARVRLLDGDHLDPGASGWAQIRLLEPVAVVKGDRFVLRSPNETLGGGKILDSHPKRHRRHHEATLSSLATLQQGTPEDTLYEVLAKFEPADIAVLDRETDLGAEKVRDALLDLVKRGRAVLVGGELPAPNVMAYTQTGFRRITDRASAAVQSYLGAHTLRPGMRREELKSRLGVTPRLFSGLIAAWLTSGIFEDHGPSMIAPPGRSIALTSAQRAEADRFLAQLRATPYAPALERLPDAELLTHLADTGAIVPVNDGVIFSADAYRRMVDEITGHLSKHGKITLAEVRDLLGTSRRYAQALLEHLDDRHVTRRVGDERVLRDSRGVTP